MIRFANTDPKQDARLPFQAGLIALLVMLQAGCTAISDDQNSVISAKWQPLHPLPTANGGFQAGRANDQILVLGGTNWSNGRKLWLDTIDRYDTGSETWASGGSLPTPVAYAAFASDGNDIYWLGGSDGEQASPHLFRASAVGSVSHIADTGYPVVYPGAAIHDGWLYVIAGGKNANDLKTLTAQSIRVSLDDGRIEELPPYPGGAVMLPAVVSTKDYLMVFGGASYNADTASVINTDQAYAYSYEERAWHRLAPTPYARRGMASCVLPDQTVLLAGGYGSLPDTDAEGFAIDLYRYNSQSGRYTPQRPLPFAAMGAALIWHNDRLYLAGGEDKPRHRTDHFYMMPLQREHFQATN